MLAQLPDPARTAPPIRPGWNARFSSTVKRVLESRERREAVPWRRILADGGLLLAMLLTSSWLIRG